MQTKDKTGCILTMALIVLCLVLLGVTRSCRFLTRSKLISIDAFPPGWQTDAKDPQPVPSAPLGGRGSIESITQSFYLPDRAGADEEIYLFENSQRASRYYADTVERGFLQTEWDDPWTIPNEVSYRGSKADQSHFACDESTSVTPMRGCLYIGQYNSYVVVFGVSWGPGYSVSYADLEKLLQAVDEEF
jgi:hypothetical protein